MMRAWKVTCSYSTVYSAMQYMCCVPLYVIHGIWVCVYMCIPLYVILCIKCIVCVPLCIQYSNLDVSIDTERGMLFSDKKEEGPTTCHTDGREAVLLSEVNQTRDRFCRVAFTRRI